MDILDQLKALGNGTIGLDEAEEMELLYAAAAEIERLRSVNEQLLQTNDRLRETILELSA